MRILLLVKAWVVLVCAYAAPSGNASDFNTDNKYIYETQYKSLYDFKHVVIQMNCGNDFIPFSKEVRIKIIQIEVCTSHTDEGRDTSYYKNVLGKYNITNSMEILKIAYGTMKNSTEMQENRINIEVFASFEDTINITSFINKCEYLQELNMTSFYRSATIISKEEASRILKPCSQLRKLNIQRTPLNLEMLKNLLSATTLWELVVRNCSLLELPNNFVHWSQQLKRLDLSYNRLRIVSFLSALKSDTIFRNLEFIDLSHNELIHSASEMYTAALMPRLQYLILDYNPHLDICGENYFIDSSKLQTNQQWVTLPDLKVLSFSFTSTSRLCFSYMKTDNLLLFNISNSRISTLSLQDFPAFTAPNFTIDLQGNNITGIKEFGIYDYEITKNKLLRRNETITTILGNVKDLKCTCKYAWLQKLLKEFSNLVVQDISCSDGVQLIHQEWELLNCTEFNCGDCVCRQNGRSAYANCSSGLTRNIPMVKNLSHIYAATNRIESLDASLFSDTLFWVDVRANQISRVNLETIRAMFSKTDRRFSLAGNPIICDCSNQVLLGTFRLHRHQIVDYDNLTCAGGEVLLHNVKEGQLCDGEHLNLGTFALNIALPITCVAVVILGLISLMYNRYKYRIKLFFYVRGWFLWCIKESEIDYNKTYDVFISFAHEDENFVTNELLPGLETGPSVFKTCIHLRDWTPGIMIPNQIVTSVEKSRRTVIVVSKSYVKSVWGLMEFHVANVSAMTERRSRVIVILLEEVSENDILDPELRLYMRTNTYLRWSDPWFWNKLRYALPQKPEK